jgi:hypothetical protein
MRYQITLNCPSRAGHSVHQIMAEHPAESLQKFMALLCEDPFVMVEEIYRDSDAAVEYYSVGALVINSNMVAKCKVHRP